MLVTLFFSVFATVTGVGIVVPLLPVYAHDLGASGFYIALIFCTYSISRIIFLQYFGRLSDKTGRKPFIISGQCAGHVTEHRVIPCRHASPQNPANTINSAFTEVRF